MGNVRKLYIGMYDWRHVPSEVLEKLYMDVPDDEEEDAWRDWEREEKTRVLLDKLMQEYARRTKKKSRVWDVVSGQEFFPSPKAPVVSQLYRWYFSRYPSQEMLPDLVRGYDEFGLTAVSEAMREWRDKFYSPRNVIDMMSMAKRLARQFNRGEPPPLPVDDIFVEPKEEDNGRQSGGTVHVG